MINLKTKAFAPEFFRNMAIEEIISAPLTAAASANSMMATEQVRFLLKFCFNEEGEHYSPKMIKMVMVKGVMKRNGDKHHDITMDRITTTFSLPLLTLIPISSLAVDTVSVDFEIEVTNQDEKKQQVVNAQPANPIASPPKSRLLGRISYDSKENSRQSGAHRYRSSNSSGLKVNIKAGQIPLAMGITTLLDLYTKSISPLEVNDQSDNKTNTSL